MFLIEELIFELLVGCITSLFTIALERAIAHFAENKKNFDVGLSPAMDAAAY